MCVTIDISDLVCLTDTNTHAHTLEIKKNMLRRVSSRLAVRRAGAFAALRVGTAAAPLVAAAAVFVQTTPMRWASHSGVSNAAQAELSEEQQRSDRPEQPVPPAGWSVSHVPGSVKIRLTKTFEDEKLEILTRLPVKEAPTGGESSSAATTPNDAGNVVLLVQKGTETMRFGLSIEDQELVLDTVSHFKDGVIPRGETPEAENALEALYPGPEIHELDSHFVDEFLNYLEVRGVDDNLAVFITEYNFWVEQQEYESWLQSVANFTR
jgi:complement component 1 Q subcomponent-binding protein, mitochondrial